MVDGHSVIFNTNPWRDLHQENRSLARETLIQELQQLHDSKEEIAWGSQIRSYVMHPYQMVKDHRINLDVGNVSSVLDGDLTPFIEGILLAGTA